ncbi:hypothetical protein ACFQX6_64280 [Streptosporangium lutulentum]
MARPPTSGASRVRHQEAVSGCFFLAWKYPMTEKEQRVWTMRIASVPSTASRV